MIDHREAIRAILRKKEGERVRFVFLHASPIVLHTIANKSDEQDFGGSALPPLHFMNTHRLVKNQLNEGQKQVEFRRAVATKEKF